VIFGVILQKKIDFSKLTEVFSFKKRFTQIILGSILLYSLTGCGELRLDPKNPVTITMWHNYGGQMQKVMDGLIDEFNSSIGRKKGVIISVTSISASKDIQEKLLMIAAGDPGAPEMPDIVTAYPKTALTLFEQGLLAPLDDQFTAKELGAYLPQFIGEGRLPDGKLYVFPIAKSTEVLFVNQTLFDRFSAATGITLNSLATFEGIADAAVKYYKWTDSLTPNKENDGKAFYTADSWFNIAQVGIAQLGGEFVTPEYLYVASGVFRRIWDFTVLPALAGGYAVTNGYSSDLSKTGEIVCSTGSTAGILFYGDSITYPDNTTEATTYTILPYPVFKGGKKIALQRGGGMCVGRSSPKKEYAAVLFLKWFTQPDQNMRFVSSTGYLPVTKKAFENNMKQEINTVKNMNLKKLLKAATQMYGEYTFLIPPNYEKFDGLSKEYEIKIKQSMLEGRARISRDHKAVSVISEELYRAFANF
jgi:multiple sugar transport system substrate-binding protein